MVFLGAFTRELRGYLISVFLIAQPFSLSLKRGKLQGVTGEYLERSAPLRNLRSLREALQPGNSINFGRCPSLVDVGCVGKRPTPRSGIARPGLTNVAISWQPWYREGSCQGPVIGQHNAYETT